MNILSSIVSKNSKTPKPWPADPLPVALVITELDVGGAELALMRLAAGLDRSRWKPTVIALGPEAEVAGWIRARGVEVVCLGLTSRQGALGVFRLARELKRLRAPLVQSFLFHANVMTRLATLLLIGRRPCVVSGMRVAEREKRWHVWIDRLTRGLADKAVCVSEGVRRFTRDVGGWPEERLTVIPNAVDLTLIDQAALLPRASLGVPSEAMLALFVGRLNVQKGLPCLLDAFERLPESTIRPIHLVIAGDGPERDWLRSRVADSATLSRCVHLLGHRSDVPSLLKTADFLVLPSLWEGMPNAVLEAMAARRGVVASAVEGTEELVAPGETGWLVPSGDADLLSRTIAEAASNPLRLQRFGDNARRRVEADFSVGGNVKSYEHVWSELLGYR